MGCGSPVLIRMCTTVFWELVKTQRCSTSVVSYFRHEVFWLICNCDYFADMKYFDLFVIVIILQFFQSCFFSKSTSWIASIQCIVWIMLSWVMFDQVYFPCNVQWNFFCKFCHIENFTGINWAVFFSVGDYSMSFLTFLAIVYEAQLPFCV